MASHLLARWEICLKILMVSKLSGGGGGKHWLNTTQLKTIQKLSFILAMVRAANACTFTLLKNILAANVSAQATSP